MSRLSNFCRAGGCTAHGMHAPAPLHCAGLPCIVLYTEHFTAPCYCPHALCAAPAATPPHSKQCRCSCVVGRYQAAGPCKLCQGTAPTLPPGLRRGREAGGGRGSLETATGAAAAEAVERVGLEWGPGLEG